MEMGRFRTNLFVGIYANAMSHCHTLHEKRAIRSKSFFRCSGGATVRANDAAKLWKTALGLGGMGA